MQDNDEYSSLLGLRYVKYHKAGRILDSREYNEKLSKLISILRLEGEAMRPPSAIREEMGEWHDLLRRRKDRKLRYEALFFDMETNLPPPVTPENRTEIAKLKRTLYPLLLCDLYKCYEQTERFQDAEAVLLEAQSLGCQGAELLLFSLYAEHMREMEKNSATAACLLEASFRRVKAIDVFSEKIADEINNAYFHAAALMMFAIGCRVFDGDAEQSMDCLVKTLRLDLPDDVREQVRTLTDCLQ